MDMVERVARALDPECFDPAVVSTYGDLWALEKQEKMRRLALAAIKAMHEPTEGMVLEVAARLSGYRDSSLTGLADPEVKEAARSIYRAMIDSILKSTRETT